MRAAASQSRQSSRSRRIAASIDRRAAAQRRRRCSSTSASWRYGVAAHGSSLVAATAWTRAGPSRPARAAAWLSLTSTPARSAIASATMTAAARRRSGDDAHRRDAPDADASVVAGAREQPEHADADERDRRQLPHPVDSGADQVRGRRAEQRGEQRALGSARAQQSLDAGSHGSRERADEEQRSPTIPSSPSVSR